MRPLFGLTLGMALSLAVAPALAHVPYIERVDFSARRPYAVGDVEQSRAMYAWLQAPDDVDYYTFEITQPVTLFLEALVPVCPAYEQFLPSYAVIGPGLPPPAEPIPVELPDGYGAVVVGNLLPGEVRPTFYEPFGGKEYYAGVQFLEVVETPGAWAVIVWDPYATGGDYVLSIGKEERFSRRDILRSLVNVPYIRRDRELHTDCTPRSRGDGADPGPAVGRLRPEVPRS